MKIKTIQVSGVICTLCLPALLVVSLSANATSLLATAATSTQAITVMSQQDADTDPDLDTDTEQAKQKAKDSKPKEEKDQAAIDEERKKYCATARKNLQLLRSNMEGRTFTTEDGKIVKYTPTQLQNMIKESEKAEKANCD